MNKKCSCSSHSCGESEKGFSSLLSFLQVMSDPTRLRILCLLRNEELCVCEILKSLELPQNLVSHHLRVLREAGLIDGARDGKFMRYSSLSSNLQQKLEEVLSVFVKK